MNFLETFFPDYFSQVDKRWVLSSLSVSVLSLAVLVGVKPNFINKNKKPIAELVQFKNNVKYKDSSSLSFYDINKNEMLQNKDEIFTGLNSVAEVRFLKSKTKIKIPSSSLVRIEESDNGDTIELKEGLVDIVLEKGNSIKLNINGELRELKTAKDIAEIKAYLTNGKLSLYSTDVAMLDKSEAFDIISPIPGESVSVDEAIRLKLTKGGNYKVALSKFANFETQSFTTSFKGSESAWNTNIDTGDYYLKVSDEKEEKIIPVKIISKFNVDGLIPGDGEVLNLAPGESVKFSWNDVMAKNYKVLVKDSLGNSHEYLTASNNVLINNLKGSEIEWSVAPEIKENKFSNAKKTIKTQLNFRGSIDLQLNMLKPFYMDFEKLPRFEWVSGDGLTYVAKLINETKDKEVFHEKLKNSHVEMKSFPMGSYKFEVSSVEYPSLKKGEYRFDVKAPYLEWSEENQVVLKSTEDINSIKLLYKLTNKENLLPVVQHKIKTASGSMTVLKHNLDELVGLKLDTFGKHCFVASITRPSRFYGDSKELCIDVIKVPVFAALPKSKDLILEYIKKNGLDSYKIAVPPIEKAAKYRIEIYKNEKATELVYNAESAVPDFYWTTNRSGIYFIRYKVYDSRNRSSDFSPVSKLIFPISPLSNW